ncbi:class I SAM-dependent methyltransferase [Aquimarina hainanensis]|uniref:Class I SAM-dependent methyltransferase n=1 Tax=Aquimarina hainanensis TaxID=1578017 RepID=A0ABW5NCZ4_9FLAO|nr:rRNA adenine N-6-methyltransferase family protein [Aquimarina sp. TRL1]QKX06588.1 16S rRNA (cytosine(1402)-N(4))-methyltransferase [Aquimarina sp. TRL1]
MKSFTKEALSTLKKSGTVTPSSKYLIRKITEDLSIEKNQVIIEFGPGNGCITENILHKMHGSTRLISFELNQTFLSYCKNKFQQYPNFSIHNQSAVYFDQVLKELSVPKVDYIISSLPLSIISKTELNILFNKIPNYLKNEGAFIQYQYSLGKYNFLKKVFNSVEIGFTFRNIPPAFIYKCS